MKQASPRSRTSESRYSIEALARGLETLELFSAERPSLSLTEIVRTLKLSKSTAFRVLSTLASLGYLERAARVLAPPKIVERNRPPQKGLSASMLWLQNHAGEYQGTWVALQDGELIDFASTRKELASKIGSAVGNSGVLITRIP